MKYNVLSLLSLSVSNVFAAPTQEVQETAQIDFSSWSAQETKLQIKASPEALKDIFQDVSGWNRWDPDLKLASLDENSTDSGTLLMNFGGKFRFTLQNVNDTHAEYMTPLPGVETIWYWDFVPAAVDQQNLTNLTMGMKCQGVVSYLYKYSLGPLLLEAFAKSTRNLKELAETGKVADKNSKVL